MTGHGSKFGRKQEEAIAALLTQRNVDEAAKSIGVSPKTLLRWMQIPEFDTAYRKARRAAFSQSTARLQQATSAAVSTLLKIMVDTGAPPSVRVRAADSVLDHAKQAIEIEDVEVRVAALEQAAKLSSQDR
jgi:transposase-like protein